MRRRDALMVHPQRHGLRRLKETPRPLGEFFQVHVLSCKLSGVHVVTRRRNRKGDAVRRLAVLAVYAVAASMALLIAAIFASMAVIYVSSPEEMKELVIVSGSRPNEHPPWLSGKDWALDVFTVDHDQHPEVHAVVTGEPRICETTYFSTMQIHVTTVHIPAHGPCRSRTTRIP
jgi:hypothetical protein